MRIVMIMGLLALFFIGLLEMVNEIGMTAFFGEISG